MKCDRAFVPTPHTYVQALSKLCPPLSCPAFSVNRPEIEGPRLHRAELTMGHGSNRLTNLDESHASWTCDLKVASLLTLAQEYFHPRLNFGKRPVSCY